MFKKLSLIFILGLAAMLLLVSCQRAASQSPTSLGTPTVDNAATAAALEQPGGMSQVQMIGTTYMIQTMTAIYDQTKAASTPVGTVGTPNTFTLAAPIPPTGVATTPAPGITPVIIVATATPGRPATYTLMPGEFPYCIARRFDVNPDDLMTLNGLTSGQILQPGMVLNIPQTGSFPGSRALHPHPSTFTVSSTDDTIYKVACYFGNVDPTQIIAANGLISPYTLHINQTLNIP